MYLLATTFALPSKLILLYGFYIEPISYMYVVSLVTVMCSSSFSLQYFATRQKETFSSLESRHSNFLTWPRQRPGPSYLNRIIWGFTVVDLFFGD